MKPGTLANNMYVQQPGKLVGKSFTFVQPTVTVDSELQVGPAFVAHLQALLSRRLNIHKTVIAHFLGQIRDMKSIPTTWTENWVDDTGRTLTIQSTNDTEYKVSISDKNGVPFKIDWTGFGLLNKKTTDLKSKITNDNDGRQHLQVEAGMVGVGPTYRLYFVVEDENEKLRLATTDDQIENIRIKPDIGIGLYDDWEDDLGVPWALPLSCYKKM